MSWLKSPIDYRTLEEELLRGLQSDRLYTLQNDAKIRAIEQNVPTYEHFRQMVNGAHLRPLKRTDIQNSHPSLWNSVSNYKETLFLPTKLLHSTEPETDISNSDATVSSKSCLNFLQVWDNIIDSKKKFEFLWDNRYNLEQIFHVEIPTSCLTQFMNVCLVVIHAIEIVNAVIDILTALSNCNRFNVAISFLEVEGKNIGSLLFQQLLVLVKSQDKSMENIVRALADKYYILLD